MQLTKQQAADKLKISIPTLNRRMKDKKIAYMKEGKLVRFADSEIEKYITKRTIKTA